MIPGPAPLRASLAAARAWRAWLARCGLAAVLCPAVLQAQAMADPVVPRGRVRLDFATSVSFWDTRYGLRSDGGSTVAEEEALGSDLTDPHGVSLFPGIPTLEQTLRSLSGDATFQAAVGSTRARLEKEVTRIDLGLRVGVFDWLTVGATVPYVNGRSTLDFVFGPDAAANLGLNPTGSAGEGVSSLLSELGDAAVAADARATSICAAGASAACQSAASLAQRANDFWQGMFGAYSATPLFPLGTAPVAARLREAVSSLDAALGAAGLPRIGAPVVFASTALDEKTFRALPSDPASGIGMTPLQSYPGMWRMGDIEANATVRLLEGERRDSAASAPRLAWALYGGFTVRFPTGLLDDPDVLLDFASGDGQRDLEGSVTAALRLGSRVDLTGGLRYGTQASVDVVRRVAPHEALLPQAATRRAVRWTPGSYTFLEVSPRIHLGEALALAAGFRRYHKAADTYALVGEDQGGAPPADVTLLSRETETTLQEVSVGLRYSSLELFRRGRVGTPAEIGVRWVSPLSGSGGQTPKATRLEASLSLFRRIWG